MGSCLRDQEKQERLRNMWVQSHFQMTALSRAIQLVDWVWDDPQAYGPLGLDTVMKRRKVNFCMA